MKKIFSCIAAVWMLASCDPVTDPVKATGIEIRPLSVTLEVGKTEELTFAVLPEQAVQKVLWESSNEKIVTVSAGTGESESGARCSRCRIPCRADTI